MPCPNCGRAPLLRERFVYGWDCGGRSCYVLKFECRRWFGLRLCFGPQREHWIEKGWWDLGAAEAGRKWNDAARLAASIDVSAAGR